MLNIPTLSFCITCKNRFHQIKETLPKNLNDNSLFKDKIEFVLVDFDSKDGLHDWIMDNFQTQLNEGYLKYYFTSELPFWHASVAKNTSHICASNDIVVNLDCDNYTGKNGGKFVIRNFLKSDSHIVLHQYAGLSFDGTFGRISLNRKDFLNLGGYDERFEPMGHQDSDLIKRAKLSGLLYKHRPEIVYSTAIKNSVDDGTKFCETNLTYFQMRDINEQKSNENIKNGVYRANRSDFGIRKNIFDYKSQELKITEKQY